MAGHYKKKRCRCQPGCNKLRTRDTRRRHYRRVLNKNEILPSESDTDASSDDDASSDESQGPVDDRHSSSAIVIVTPHSDGENDTRCSDHGADSDSKMDEDSDNGDYIDMPGLELPDFADGEEDPLELGDVEYGDEDLGVVVMLEEMWEELEDVVGGSMEQALHDASKLEGGHC